MMVFDSNDRGNIFSIKVDGLDDSFDGFEDIALM